MQLQNTKQLKDAPTAEAKLESGFGSDYQKLLFSDSTYAGGVSQILVNGNVWEKVSSKYSLFRRNTYIWIVQMLRQSLTAVETAC